MRATFLELPVLDVRGVASRGRRVRGSVNIPADELQARRMELPPRGVRYAVLADASTAGDAERLHASFPDDVVAVLRGDDDAVWHALPPSRVCTAADDDGGGNTAPRFWKPGALVAEARAALPTWLGAARGEPLRVLDAGSGMGRNAVFLAEDAPPTPGHLPCAVTAVDNRRVMERLCADFAARCGVGDRIDAVTGDVLAHMLAHAAACENGDALPYDVVLLARFMDKRALSAAGACLPGARPGVVVVEHFHAEAAHPARAEDKLVEGEVLTLCAQGEAARGGTGRWSLVLERRSAAEDGRPLLHAVVRREPPLHAPAGVDGGATSAVG